MLDHYEIILYWSEVNEAFLAEVPEILGCIAHGEAWENALDRTKRAICLRLNTAKDFSNLIPETNWRRLDHA